MDYAMENAAKMQSNGILGGNRIAPEPIRTLDGIADAANRVRGVRRNVERMIDRASPSPEICDYDEVKESLARISYSEALERLRSELDRLDKATELLGQHV